MFKTKNWPAICCLICLSAISCLAQKPSQGSISGFVIEKSSDKPLEFVQIILKKAQDSTFVSGTVSDSKGKFSFEKIPFGDYRIKCAQMLIQGAKAHCAKQLNQ